MNEQYLQNQIDKHNELMESARNDGDFNKFTFHEGEIENYEQMMKTVKGECNA